MIASSGDYKCEPLQLPPLRGHPATPLKSTEAPHPAKIFQVPGFSLKSLGNRSGYSQPVTDTRRPPPGQKILGPGTGPRQPPSGRGHSGAKIPLPAHRAPAGVGRTPEPLPSAPTPDFGHKRRSNVPWTLQRNPKTPFLGFTPRKNTGRKQLTKTTSSI